MPGVELVVAHFNHGIRGDSTKDEELVRKSSKNYSLPFEVGHGNLGPAASEEKARNARYKFLRAIQKKHGADAIVTAHHQDDLIETAILNILRGTGRRGLSSIAGNPNVLRPLLAYSKRDILAYAKKNKLLWREDASNNDLKYLRNYIRIKIVPNLGSEKRQQLLSTIDKATINNKALDQEIANLSQTIVNDNGIQRAEFIALPIEIANEVIMELLRRSDLGEFDKKTVDRLTLAVRTAQPGSSINAGKDATLQITASEALLRTSVRA